MHKTHSDFCLFLVRQIQSLYLSCDSSRPCFSIALEEEAAVTAAEMANACVDFQQGKETDGG